MNKHLIILLLLFFLNACSASTPVNVVNSKPKNCTFITTVSVPQCSAGLLAHAETTEDSLKVLKSETAKSGGNTMECCAVENEETVISGVNLESGQVTCIGVVQHSANVYKCKN